MDCLIQVIESFNKGFVHMSDEMRVVYSEMMGRLLAKNMRISCQETFQACATVSPINCFYDNDVILSPHPSGVPNLIYKGFSDKSYTYVMILNPEFVKKMEILGIDLTSPDFLTQFMDFDFYKILTFVRPSTIKSMNIPSPGDDKHFDITELSNEHIIGLFTSPSEISDNELDTESGLNHILYAFSCWLKDVITAKSPNSEFSITYNNTVSSENINIRSKDIFIKFKEDRTDIFENLIHIV